MKKFVLTLFTFFLTVYSYGQSENVLTYPLSLLYKKHLKECLEPYNVSLKEIEPQQNTFVATLDFVERFKSSCDPIIFDFYAQNDKALWEIDLEVAAYYDSLSTVNGVVEVKADLDTEEETESTYATISKEFKRFSSLQKGNLKAVNYGKINNKSTNLLADLQQLGLSREEAENYVQLLNKN